MALTKPSDKMLAPGSSLTLATKQASTSGTSIDFTGIPAGTKEIVVMLSGVSTNGTSGLLIQLGDAGGVETSGYDSVGMIASSTNLVASESSSAGFLILSGSAANVHKAVLRLTLFDAATFSWMGSGTSSVSTYAGSTAGSKTLSAELDRVRITTANGTDTFDAGNINIAYK